MTKARDVVLVVDDSPETLSFINDALDQAGMVTLVALSGQQAIHIARKMAPDLILLDALMPQMSGFETCKIIKQDLELHHIPVIFMTGLTETEHIIAGFGAGGVDYLTKPINPIELMARIKTHLNMARTVLSAQSALDTTGQNLCAVNAQGQLLWATPWVNHELERLGKGNWTQLGLAAPIARWLALNPKEGAHMSTHFEQTGLQWIRVRQNSDDEFLLKLVIEGQIDEVQILRKHLNVTQRESEVLLWVAKGKTNREIGQILDLSPRTVNKHLEQLFKKIGVDNRSSATALAVNLLQTPTA
jgi:DNA-binding NarL/FixJ family response regulator